MKKVFLLIIVFLFVLMQLNLYSGVKIKKDFRDATWGMSRNQVKKTEKLQFNKLQNDSIYCSTNLLGLNVLAVYMFENNKLYKDDIENYGLAVSIGHLKYSAFWELPKTTIKLDLKGDNYDISLGLTYMSKKIKPKNKPNKL